jgi:hydroxyacid-oxoacid transhydrogenase
VPGQAGPKIMKSSSIFRTINKFKSLIPSSSLCRCRCFSSNEFEFDNVCELAASNLRFGPGATAEVGQDLAFMRREKVIVVTDSTVSKLDSMKVLVESLQSNGIDFEVFDQVRIEPNDQSFRQAIRFFSETKYDAVVALGGGSVIDTAKAANLYATYKPEDFYDYVNPPLGKGLPIPGDLPPLIAIPTTAGTGSETTGVAIFDDTPTQSKTGIANRKLKPTLGIVDPDNTASMPKAVATYSGLDVLCHAIESYTALPYDQRSKPSSPVYRPAYQGSNPISDVWSMFALQTTAKYLRRAAADPQDDEARANMLIASAAAGMGFGNAGVHLCHGMSYPIASQVKSYYPEGYDTDHPLVPHGLSVVVTAPSVFSFTGVSNPERHATCAQMLKAARTNGDDAVPTTSDSGRWLAEEIRYLMQDLGVPFGLKTFGYTEDDIPSLVQGTLPQHRVTKLSPRPVGEKELESLFMNVLDDEQ